MGGAFAPTRWLAMTSEQNTAFSRRNASELLERRPPSEKQRGRRECRMRVAPVAACAAKKHRRQQPQVHRISRHSPRNGFNGFLRALPGDRALLPPSSADRSANLTPASGRQDHTTSPSAKASFVRAHFARLTLPRPSHPAPNVRDDREAPLLWARDGRVLEVIWGARKQKYFCKRGWTAKSLICPSGSNSPLVLAGLDPAIHLRAKDSSEDRWIRGSSPRMTSL